MARAEFSPGVLAHAAEEAQSCSHGCVAHRSFAIGHPFVAKKAAPGNRKDSSVSGHGLSRAIACEECHFHDVSRALTKRIAFGAIIAGIFAPDASQPGFHHTLHAVVRRHYSDAF